MNKNKMNKPATDTFEAEYTNALKALDKDWLDLMVDCTCGREHKWRIHKVEKDTWVEKLK